MTDFDNLKKAFRSCFKETDFHFSGNCNTYIFAAPQKLNELVHYELIKRGEQYFIEFHIECKGYDNLVNQLNKKLGENPGYQRLFFFDTYYNDRYWKSRLPIFTEDDIKNDIKNIRDFIDPILPAAQNLQRNNPVSGNHRIQLQGGYALCTPQEIATHLAQENLKIPNVQRGKVWNVARIGTLWDSIMRGFPIGTFSVQEDQQGKLDLLDGQQRATAISLGYEKFPPSNKKKPILWIDLDEENKDLKFGSKRFSFHVTTCSQPWGYELIEDEMRNRTLPTEEKRQAIGTLDGHCDNAGKPYPYELYPVRASRPIPFALLTSCQDLSTCDEFKKTLPLETHQSWLWLKKIIEDNWMPSQAYWSQIKEAVKQLNDYKIFLIDSSRVESEDIALFFTRIGRGGVMPSDEELAYSVLKAKIGGDFRQKIEEIAENGMAAPARIAHLAIRCFASTKENEDKFYCGSVLEQANRIGQNNEKGNKFGRFVDEKFTQLISKVNEGLGISADKNSANSQDGCFTQWHRSRYCTNQNGDLYLFLLLTAHDDENNLKTAIALAEYIHCFANEPRRVLRLLRKEGLKNGLFSALKETHYGKPILSFPFSPDKLPDFPQNGWDEIRKWWNDSRNSYIIEFIKNGYRNPKAYSVLLFACSNVINNMSYDPCLAEWADESCPWDYDHILPQSWFEKIHGMPEADFCEELKNSIGNLAPLPFSINRSLSDSERTAFYPYQADCNDYLEKREKLYNILSEDLVSKAFYEGTGSIERQKYCISTISRFKRLYSVWFNSLGLSDIFKDFSESVQKRINLFVQIRKRQEGLKIFYTDGERQYEWQNEMDWWRPWLAIGKDTKDGLFAAVASDGFDIEVGRRRNPEKTDIGGKNIWYESNQCKTFNFEVNIEELLKELGECFSQYC